MDETPDGLLIDPPDQLRAFISHGRITAMPAKRTRCRLLLDQVVQAFEPGHRRNILSSSFTHIGTAVYRDSSGTVWLTQDFSN